MIRRRNIGKYIVNQKWFKVIFITITSFYLYVLMEWIFYVTKPSFMSSMNFSQKWAIYFLSSIFLATPGIFVTVLLFILSQRIKLLHWIPAMIPALVVAVLSLIMLDNFTYTVFKFGIGTAQGVWRGVYIIVFISLFLFYQKHIIDFLKNEADSHFNAIHVMVALLVVTSVIFVAASLPSIISTTKSDFVSGSQSSNLPNIILLGFDGVNATNMSVYGYERDTTPNLKILAENALVIENAYSNGGNTGGSITSLLTGKLPTETHVVYPPDILMGEDAYQHLPGILKQLGYFTVQISDSSFSDAYSRNIKDGFNVANSRSETTGFLVSKLGKFGGGGSFYFYALLIQRATDRLGHIFYLREMDNPYKLITNPVSELNVQEQYEAMISALDNVKGPLFLHVLMLGTHGPQFSPRENVFSAGESQEESWMLDFYDDAILDSDKYIQSLFDYLTKNGKINNTLVILYSDHGLNWNPLNRVPLMFWFPNHEFTGEVNENIQLLDIAPTILDYLGVSIPSWMHGQSILRNDLPADRKIFSAEQAVDMIVHNEKGWVIDESKVSPPFYQLGKVNMIVCNRWYSLNLRTPGLTSGNINGSTSACNLSQTLNLLQSKDLILQYLTDVGYDTTSFPAEIPMISLTK